MRYLCLALLFSTSLVSQAQTSFTASDLNISFYSSTPLKNFKAYSTSGTSTISSGKQEVEFSVDISSFVFYRLLMQEHFNTNYMESNRYPKATFRGHFVQPVDFSKDGQLPVAVQGTLEVHGKKSKREIGGLLTIKDGTVYLKSDFIVSCAEHGIVIPESLQGQIAPDIQVQVRGEYTPAGHLVKK
ncbi:MAG TPA: YceI family protein [Anseongella sp.]|nr:YceI family protein [Anseongella sp.]